MTPVVNDYATCIRGNNSTIFIFTSHLGRGKFLRDRICSKQFFFFFFLRVDPLFGKARLSRDAKDNAKMVSFTRSHGMLFCPFMHCHKAELNQKTDTEFQLLVKVVHFLFFC